MAQVMETEVVETHVRDKHRETPTKKSHRWIYFLGAMVLSAVASLWWIHAQRFESTDDAQIEGHLDTISARISGTVVFVNPKVENNQYVEAGTLLVALDPSDFEADVEHARANLETRRAEAHSAQVTVPIVDASAFGQLRSAEAARDQAIASVSAEQGNLLAAQHKLEMDQAIYARAERDRVRYEALVAKHEISRSEYDARETEALTASHAVESDRAEISSREQRVNEARNLITQREAQIEAARSAPQQVTDAQAKSQSASGRVHQASADLHTAQLNLGYTKIYAPVSGVIGRKTVELGHRIQPGQGLLVIVPLDDIWITANFKETQMKHIRPGQHVKVYVDTFGREYEGTVENLPGAAGPLFSLFPPENATGNYVKVVQRFPVRIRFNQGQDSEKLLRPGMSVEPTVEVR